MGTPGQGATEPEGDGTQQGPASHQRVGPAEVRQRSPKERGPAVEPLRRNHAAEHQSECSPARAQPQPVREETIPERAFGHMGWDHGQADLFPGGGASSGTGKLRMAFRLAPSLVLLRQISLVRR